MASNTNNASLSRIGSVSTLKPSGTSNAHSSTDVPITAVHDQQGVISVPQSLLASSSNLADRSLSSAVDFQPPKDGEFESKFFRGLSIERSLSEQENTLVALVENAANRHGFDVLRSYLSGIPEEYLRRLAKLKREAKNRGISSATFYDFFELMLYSKKVTTAQAQHKGCVVDIIIAGSSIALSVQDLFNGGEVRCNSGVRLNGIFGKQGIVRTVEDLSSLNDLMPFMYITTSTMSHGYPLAAYYLFFGETPNPVTLASRDARNASQDQHGQHRAGRLFLEHNSGPWFNAKLILERTQKFMDEAAAMCLEVTHNPPGVILTKDDKSYFMPVVTAIYDIESMTMWRVEHAHGHIVAQRLEEYLKDHLDYNVYKDMPMFARKDVVLRHIDRLTSHSSHGDEHLQLRHQSFKKVGCVDGRQHNNCSELGALLSETEFENVLLDNHTSRIDMVFHTECGYVYTAITLHKLFHAIRIGADPDDKLTPSRAVSFITTLMKSPWISREPGQFKEFISHVDLSKVSPDPKVQQQVYDDLFSFFTDNSGTLRYATSHMMDRGLFTVEQGFLVMTATMNVENALRRHGIDMEPENARVLVVEEIARTDRQSKTRWLQKHKAKIERDRIDETLPTLEWKMEDLVTGRNYFIPPKFALDQSKAELSNMMRQDVVTHVWFNLTRPDAVPPGHLQDADEDGIDLFLHPIGPENKNPSPSTSFSDSSSSLPIIDPIKAANGE